MLYPLTFKPIFKDRVWGGRRLEQIYQKPLPPGVPIGESWEISDRAQGQSVVVNGPLVSVPQRAVVVFQVPPQDWPLEPEIPSPPPN